MQKIVNKLMHCTLLCSQILRDIRQGLLQIGREGIRPGMPAGKNHYSNLSMILKVILSNKIKILIKTAYQLMHHHYQKSFILNS